MGYVGKLAEKLRAQELRKKGLSYREILQHINVSKDTISRWCRDIPLTKKQKERLIKNKIFGQRKGSIVAADNKRRARIKRTKLIMKEAKKELGRISKRDRFVAGVAFYAAEGTKFDGKITFSNSDPKLIKFMTDWFKDFCKVNSSKLRGRIWIHENRNEHKAKKFWSKLTRIPIDQFYKSYVAENKLNSRKIRKKIHKYGVFAVGFSDSEIHRKIMGWITGVIGSRMI